MQRKEVELMIDGQWSMSETGVEGAFEVINFVKMSTPPEATPRHEAHLCSLVLAWLPLLTSDHSHPERSLTPVSC